MNAAAKANETAANATETAASKPTRSKRASSKKQVEVVEQPAASAEESSASTQEADGAGETLKEVGNFLNEQMEQHANPPSEGDKGEPSAPVEVEKVEGWDIEPAERPTDVPKAVQLSSGVKQVTLAVIHNPPATLAEIEVDIKKQMVNIANSFLRIGGLLILSREFFDKQDKFLAWSETSFGIKKAQVYKLMKVHQEFGEDARFKGVAMRVLDMLTGQPESLKGKAADILANTGKLETKTTEALIAAEKQQGAVIDTATGEKQAPLTIEQLDSVQVINPEVGQPTGEPATVPGDTDRGEGSQVQQALNIAKLREQAQDVAPEGEKSELAQLNDTINRLMEELAALRQENEALKGGKKKAAGAAPMLKQFKHAEPQVVLGISESESKDKKAIKGAVRELSAIWNNDTNPEAWALISAAADALLKDAK